MWVTAGLIRFSRMEDWNRSPGITPGQRLEELGHLPMGRSFPHRNVLIRAVGREM
jgi:hypothetical protein